MKRTAIARKTPLRRTPFLVRVSDGQRVKNAEFRRNRRRRAEMVEYICEARIEGVCDGYGTQAHHVVRRSQGGTNDVANLRWLCAADHRWVHANPGKATALGLLASSSAPAPSASTPAPTEQQGFAPPPPAGECGPGRIVA